MKKTQKPPFLHIEVSEIGRATTPQNNINLYSVSRILVLVIQKDMSTRTKVIAYRIKVYIVLGCCCPTNF
jgi:hypothetical protein